MNKKIDVIIPYYNSSKFISKALLSISMQLCCDLINVCIVDDCSDDNCDEIINLFKNKLSITLLILDKNHGAGYARNYGLEHTKSDYVFFLDSDDVLYNCFSLDILYKNITKFDCDILDGNVKFDKSKTESVIFNHFQYCTHGKLFSRKFLESNNIRYSNERYHEDNYFMQLALSYKPKVRYCESLISEISSNNRNSLTRSKNNYMIDTFDIYLKNILNLINNFEERNLSKNYISNYVVYHFGMCFFLYYVNDKYDKRDCIIKYVYPLYLKYLEYKDFINDIERHKKIYNDFYYGNVLLIDFSLEKFISLIESSSCKDGVL